MAVVADAQELRLVGCVCLDEDLFEDFLYTGYSVGRFGQFERLLGCSILSVM